MCHRSKGFNGWSDPFRFKSLEVSSDKITKADGIVKALNHIGVDIKNAYAFGDGFNDAEMLERVGTGIAMGTASDDLKRRAKFVVPSVLDDGVAVGIEQYILGEWLSEENIFIAAVDDDDSFCKRLRRR